jgi:hypothetical protein
MNNMIQGFVHLKDVSLTPYAVVAYSKTIIPQTIQTPEYPALTIWLRDVPQAIIAVYETEEERDKDAITLTKAVASISS